MFYLSTLDGIHPIYNMELGLGTITTAFESLVLSGICNLELGM